MQSSIAYLPKDQPNHNKNKPYTQIENDILLNISRSDITARQHRVLYCIIRKTLGFHKDYDWISASQIKKFCNYYGAETHINSDIRKLIDRRILIKKGNKVGLNQKTEKWILTKTGLNESKPNVTENGSSERPKTVTTKETTTKEKLLLCNSIKEHKLKKSDNFNVYDFKTSSAIQPKPSTKPPKKKNTRKPSSAYAQIDFSKLPDEIPIETAEAFVEHRKAIKKPLTQYAFNLAMKQAMMGIQLGISPQDVIDCAILHGWVGVNAQYALNKLQQQSQYIPYQGGSINATYQGSYEKLSTVDEANRAADEYRRRKGLPYTP